MRKIILALTLTFAALASTGCDQATLDANMTKARATLAAIRQGAAVTASAIRQGIDEVCAAQPAVGISYQTIRAVMMQQTGPNSTQNIRNLDNAMTGYTTVCAQAADPNATDLASLLSRAIAAYAAFQSASAKAQGV